jgi:hypothetical protein
MPSIPLARTTILRKEAKPSAEIIPPNVNFPGAGRTAVNTSATNNPNAARIAVHVLRGPGMNKSTRSKTLAQTDKTRRGRIERRSDEFI